jgi:hypothetical protein
MNSNDLRGMSEKIRDHLKAQKARAMGTNDGGFVVCRYRGDGGSMCAVGCLIPDERYTPTIEGNSAGNAGVLRALLGREAYESMPQGDTERLVKLLCDWQYYHDHADYEQWGMGEPSAFTPDDVHNQMVKVGRFEG